MECGATEVERFAAGHVSFLCAGDPQGTPVVLLNGLGLTAADWTPQITALVSSGRRVVAVDRRGHGHSPYRRVDTFDQLVQDVVDVIDSLEFDEVEVCGLSLGGTEAIALALAHPRRITALVLADTFAQLSPALAEARMTAMRQLHDDLGIDGLAETVVEGMVFQDLGADRRAELAGSFVALGADAFFELMDALYACAFDDRLHELSATPTLVLGAAHDSRTPLTAMKALHTQIPGSGFAEIAGAGHFPHIEQPDAFSAHLVEFLTTARSNHEQ